jgi:tRNA (guanine-N7-)-methyltransferase
VFGDSHPVEIEIGPGRGETLLAAARACPGTNFFGIERVAGAAAAIGAAAALRGLTNVRVVAGDARCIVARLVPEGSVSAYHIYFPDPWPKTRHRARRLATAEFGVALHRSLVPGGVVHVMSDLRTVVEAFVHHLTRAGLVHRAGVPPPRARPTTRFERKYGSTAVFYARLERV